MTDEKPIHPDHVPSLSVLREGDYVQIEGTTYHVDGIAPKPNYGWVLNLTYAGPCQSEKPLLMPHDEVGMGPGPGPVYESTWERVPGGGDDVARTISAEDAEMTETASLTDLVYHGAWPDERIEWVTYDGRDDDGCDGGPEDDDE